MKKFTTVLMLAVSALTIAAPATSRGVEFKLYYNPSDRAVIRQMPITERPFRPIHVYGNAVRLLNWVGVPVAK